MKYFLSWKYFSYEIFPEQEIFPQKFTFTNVFFLNYLKELLMERPNCRVVNSNIWHNTEDAKKLGETEVNVKKSGNMQNSRFSMFLQCENVKISVFWNDWNQLKNVWKCNNTVRMEDSTKQTRARPFSQYSEFSILIKKKFDFLSCLNFSTLIARSLHRCLGFFEDIFFNLCKKRSGKLKGSSSFEIFTTILI